MSYTSFVQKPHFLFRNNICCFCVERHCFILQTVYLPSPLSWTTAYLLELNSCQWFGCLKKRWPLFSVIALFSLPVWVLHTQTHGQRHCVRTSFVAVWGFLSCLHFYLHISSCNKMDSDSAWCHPPTSLESAHLPIQQVAQVDWCKGSVKHSSLEYRPWRVFKNLGGCIVQHASMTKLFAVLCYI